MLELIYVYNTFLIIFYSVIMTLSINCFVREKSRGRKHFFLVLILYFFFFIIDNLVITMTELISSFGSLYNNTFMGVSLIKTLVYVVNNFCQIRIVNYIKKEKNSLFQYLYIICIFIGMMLIPMFPSSALKVYIYYSVNQIFLIYVGYIAIKGIHKKSQLSKLRLKYLKYIAYICILAGIAILLEDTFVIFNVDKYHVLDVKIQNRNISEDIFSVMICILCCKYFFDMGESSSGYYKAAYEGVECTDSCELHEEEILKEEIVKKETLKEEVLKEEALKEEVLKDRSMNTFFDFFNLTDREKEICKLVLEHKHNSEIAQELFLAIGTVKTHIHNIYIKMNIKNRNQIFNLYHDFIQKK